MKRLLERMMALPLAAVCLALPLASWAETLVHDAYVPTTAATVFEGVQLSDIGTKYFLAATMDGGYIDGPGPANVCNRDVFTNSSSEEVVRYELQIKDGSYIKCVIVELTQDGDDIKAVATNARYTNASNGIGFRFQESGENGAYNGVASIAPATSDSANGYGVSGLRLAHSELLYYISCDNYGDGGVALATDGGIGTVVPTAWKSGYRNYDGTKVKFGTNSAKLNSGTLGLVDNTSGLGVGTSDGFTVSFWANIGTDIQNWASFIALRIGSENYRLEHMSNDSFAMYRGTGDAPFEGLSYTAGEWAHYALVFGSDGSLTVYQNGTSVKTASGFSGVLTQAAMGPGRSGSAADATLRGQSIGTTYIDDLAIFKGTLTAEEIGEIVAGTTPISGFTGDVNPSININFASGATAISTSGKVGASDYAVPGTYWNTMTSVGGSTFNTPLSTVSMVSTAGYKLVSAGTSVTVEGTRGSWYYYSGKATKSLLHGYVDDGNNDTDTPIATVTGIPSDFDYYRVVLYFSNDTDGTRFGYVSLNEVEYWGTANWGSANHAALTEGGNYLVSPVLPLGDGTLKITTRDLAGSRAGLAAVQIIKAEPEFTTIEVADGDTSTVDLVSLLETYDYVKFVCPGDFTLAFTSEAQLTPAMLESLDFSEVDGTVSLGANVVYDISVTRTLPTEFTFTTGSTVVVTETSAEYGADWFTVSDLDGVSYVKLNRADGTTVTLDVENGSVSLGTGDVKIGGAATIYDITFKNNKEDIGKYAGYGGTEVYKNDSGTFTYSCGTGSLKYDYAAAFANADGAVTAENWDEDDDTIGLYAACHPYIDGARSVFSALGDFTVVVVGTMPTAHTTTFIHIGDDDGTNQGLLIGTADEDNKVLIATTKGPKVYDGGNESVCVTIPNAATARHAFVVIKKGTTFTVYADGVKRGNFSVGSDFALGTPSRSGLQVGSDFGGTIHGDKGTSTLNKKYVAVDLADTTALVNVIRVFDYSINEAQALAVTTAYPYVSEGGLYTRTVSGEVKLSATEAWDRDGDTETKYDLPVSVVEGYNPSVTITVEDTATLAVNATLNVDTLTIGGSAALTIEKDGDYSIRPATAVVSSPVTTEYGALDLIGVPIEMSGEGSLTFDCSDLNVSAGAYQLTGLIERDDDRVTVVRPTDVNYFYETSYNNGCYELVATLAEATYNNTPYETLAAAIEAAAPGDAITLNGNVDGITLDKAVTITADSGVTSVGTVTITAGTVMLPVGAEYTLSSDTWATASGEELVMLSYAESATVTVAETENGTVAIDADEMKGTASPYIVKVGTTVTITVTPDEGYKVASVTANDTPVEPVQGVYSVTVSEGTEIVATFAPNTHTVFVPDVDGATVVVTANDETVTGDNDCYTVPHGYTVVVTYTADPGKYISGTTSTTKVIDLGPVTTDNVVLPETDIPEPATIVATIGDACYGSLAAAVTEATDGQTVKLLANVTLDARVEPNLGSGTTLTIDLGGYTITPTVTCGNGSAFDVKSGTVTIKNGSIDGSAITTIECDPITARSGTDVTLEGLTITICSKNGACAYAFDGARMTIKSGTYANTTTEPYQYKTEWTGMAVNQDTKAAKNTQLLFIEGGSFKQVNPALGDDSGNSVTFLAEGYESTWNPSTGYWDVAEKVVPPAPSGIDPTDPESTQEVEVDTKDKTQKQIEEAAIAAATVTIPEAVATAEVTEETYKNYFTYTVTEKSAGVYEVAIADLNEEVVFPAEEAEDLTANLAEVLDVETGADVEITNAKPGLFYSIEAASSVDFPTETTAEGKRELATTTTVSPVKPDKTGTAVFYRVKVSYTDK